MLREAPTTLQFWVIALLIGIAAGAATVLFRQAIIWLQELVYGANDRELASFAAGLDWWWIILIPLMGGLVVGFLTTYLGGDGRTRSVAHVIEGAALREGRVEKRAGLSSALASLITLSTGGSTGREGPVVHLGAVISSYVSNLIKADGITARDLMGCAVAAAVSASFNAPIAGALFALEVVLRHFAFHAFAPIVVASVAGTVVSRLSFGDITEFALPAHTLAFYVELPAFMLLGLTCGLVAVVMMRAFFIAEDTADQLQEQLGIPNWLRPALAGAVLGCLAIAFPHIIGVGYETTSRALTGSLLMWEAFVFALIKVLAVAITVAGRMGGGVFSPALMVGALTGLTFGYLATAFLPDLSDTETIYALAGMGAVAAAVLGAPISTTLIVFELTGDWQAGIAVMVAVSLATVVSQYFTAGSYFHEQLLRRGIRVAEGPQQYVLSTISVSRVMRVAGDESGIPQGEAMELVEQGAYVDVSDTLDKALPLLETAPTGYLPVMSNHEEEAEILGAIYYVDALQAFNRALAEATREEHT